MVNNGSKTAYWVIGIALLLVVAGVLYWQANKDRIQAPVEEQVEQGETATTTDQGNVDVKKDLIQTNIQANQIVMSPLKITGEARGNWYFEASFPVKILDANGKVLAQAPAQAKGEWMTTNFVPFELTLTFAKPNTDTGWLVLEKDNPSGLPQYADELKIPIRFQ